MAEELYLRFEARPPGDGCKPLLWPAHVWKVAYPAPQSLRLNLFQRTILQFARAGLHDVAEMARLLDLDPDLVRFIIATELTSSAWMDARGRVTPTGLQILGEEEDARDEIRIGFAYQDAISGEWMPRFSEDLPYVESLRREGPYPVFLRSRASGAPISPFQLRPIEPPQMDADGLFEALKRHRKEVFQNRRETVSGERPPPDPQMRDLSFVSSQSQLMWLWTWVFKDESGTRPWLVADPFNPQGRAVPWLRKPLQKILPEQKELARRILEMLDESPAEGVSAAAALAALEERIGLRLLSGYAWIEKLPLAREHLISVLRARARLDAHHVDADLRALLVESQNLAESVLQWMLRRYPPDARRLPSETGWREGGSLRALQELRAPCLAQGGAAERLARQNFGQVRSAVKYREGSLKALLFAALLASAGRPDHPLRLHSAQSLRLDQLLDMADARNKGAGHASAKELKKDETAAHAEFVLEWAAIFKDQY